MRMETFVEREGAKQGTKRLWALAKVERKGEFCEIAISSSPSVHTSPGVRTHY